MKTKAIIITIVLTAIVTCVTVSEAMDTFKYILTGDLPASAFLPVVIGIVVVLLFALMPEGAKDAYISNKDLE